MQQQQNQFDATMKAVMERMLSSESSRSKRTLMREIALRTIVRQERILRELKAILRIEVRTNPNCDIEKPSTVGILNKKQTSLCRR